MGRTQRLEQPKIFGKYQLTARLAHGRMGDVYKAKSLGVEGFEKILVVKVIHPTLGDNSQFIEALVDEAKRAVSLSHANVAQVYDLGEAQQNFYIAVEYVNGYDLARALNLARTTNHPWSQDLAIFIASEIAKGLDYAHRRKDFNFNNLNILHRALTPENIMLSIEGDVKLTDFGLSRALDYVEPSDEQDIIGRLKYAAPEVAYGQEYRRQSDIFSLGLVLFEMLSGVHPYQNADASNIHLYAQHAQIPSITDYINVPRQLAQLVESMVMRNPDARAQSAGDVYESLISYLFGNNLKGDNRMISLLMQELRRNEHKEQPEMVNEELGLEEISQHELQHTYTINTTSIFVDTMDFSVSDVSEAALSHLSSVTAGRSLSEQSEALAESSPKLPGSMESFFRSASRGRGKAVLVSGRLGSGHHYLPDRLIESLVWRENTNAFAVQTTTDDKYRPFGVLGDLLLQCLASPSNSLSDRRLEALNILQNHPISSEALTTLKYLWGMSDEARAIGYLARQKHLTELMFVVLRHLSQSGPLALIIDRVERADVLSVDVLRDIIAGIGKTHVMLVIGTDTSEATRATFNQGQPEDLEAVSISGHEQPPFNRLEELSDDAINMLIVLALSEHPLHQITIEQLLGTTIDEFMTAAQTLADMDFVRIPRPGVFMCAMPDSIAWLEKNFNRTTIEYWADKVASLYAVASSQEDSARYIPTLVRLYALAGHRHQLISSIDHYHNLLKSDGWLQTLLDFLRRSIWLLDQPSIGVPALRLDLMLARAELALELAQYNECHISLEPLTVLSEKVRHESGYVRAQLLLGQKALQQGDLDDALVHFRRGITTAKQLHHPALVTRCYMALAQWYDRFGDARQMQSMIDGAMAISKHWQFDHIDADTQVRLLQQCLMMVVEQGRIDQANKLYEELYVLAIKHNSISINARVNQCFAVILAEEGKYHDAVETIRTAVSMAHRHGLITQRIEILRTYAAIALASKNYELTLSSAEMLIELARRHQDIYSENRGLDIQSIASAMLNLNTQQAIQHLQNSLQRAQARNIPRDILRAHANLSQVYQVLGEHEKVELHRGHAAQLSAIHANSTMHYN